MVDIHPLLAAKSNQLNADDLIGGDLTIEITEVIATGSAEQPIAVRYNGDNNKPWFPCKTMLRAMAAIWETTQSQEYVGRKLTLYRDPAVVFGGVEVGGIRINHASHITKEINLMLTKSRGGKKGRITVKPLQQSPSSPAAKATPTDADRESKAEAAKVNLINAVAVATPELLATFTQVNAATLSRLKEAYFSKYEEVVAALVAKETELAQGDF